MPSGTKRILEEWLRSPIEYQGELEISAMGILQGSVISPLIANFTLDGLEERVTTRQQIVMTNFNKTKLIKRKGHKSLFSQTQKTTLVCFIMYADNFVIIINDERLVEQYVEETKSFLVEHGLQLSS